MSYATAIARPFVRLFDWYRRPDPFIFAVTGTMVLDARPTRRARAAQADVLLQLIEDGHTPATTRDVNRAFRIVEGRSPSPAEAAAVCSYAASFGLLA